MKKTSAIDDACVPYLNQLSMLKLLHLGGTSISLEGLLQLSNLLQLEELFFSYTGEIPAAKVHELKLPFPICEIVVNHKAVS